MSATLTSRGGRLAAVLLLLVGILVAGVAAGAQSSAPQLGDPPALQAVLGDREGYIGVSLVVDGTVLDTDPVRIRATSRYDESVELTLRGRIAGLEVGDTIIVHGTLESEAVLSVEETIHKPSSAFMISRGLSLLAGLWVVARAARDWRIDLARFAFVPVPDASSADATAAAGGDDD